MKLQRAVVAAVAVLVLGACTGPVPPPDPPRPTQTRPVTAVPSTTAAASVRAGTAPAPVLPGGCEYVSPEMLRTIAGGAPDRLRITPITSAAVRSADYPELYMIAMRFSVPGVGEEFGVWASNSLQPGGGLIIAVDDFAQNFTQWPAGDTSSFKISQTDHGVEEAEICVSSVP